MRHIVIGDPHGCSMELEQLLSKINPAWDDEVIIIGDLLHKGPDEVGVIEIARKHCNLHLSGNHEDKQIRWERHHKRFLEQGIPNPMKHVEDYKPLPEYQLKWLKDTGLLWMQIEAGEKKYLLVHAGIEPVMYKLPENQHMLTVQKKERWAMSMLRCRYVTPAGRMVSLGAEKEEDVFWPEVYDGRFGHVLFGHQPFTKRDTPREYEHATALDLGVVYGNRLCAAIIDGDTGEMTYETVPALDKYMLHRSETGSTNPIPE